MSDGPQKVALPKYIKVKYLCSCIPFEVEVNVPERHDQQDIGDWVERILGTCIGMDHQRRSPRCTRTTMTHATIPVGNTDDPRPIKIGQNPKLN